MPDINLPVGYGTRSLTTNDANVSDELGRTGLALGDLIAKTGLAVAETQSKLTISSAETASALAKTLVDVIAVEEKVYDDAGNLTEIKSHTRKLPLINFIDPAFYQWSKVRLQGQYFAREFATDTSYSASSTKISDGSGQSGLFAILGGGYNKYSFKHNQVDSTTTSTDDYSAGNIRMNVLLEPRNDVTVPKPRQVIQGPRLALLQGEIEDIKQGNKIVGRTMSLLLQYNKRNGTPIAGKTFSVETNGVPWSYTGADETDANGQVEIQLRRDFVGEEPDTSPVDVIVTARKGLVQNTITVTF